MASVAADVGGTHVRFAVATIAAGRVVAPRPETVVRAADHAGLPAAWAALGAETASAGAPR